MRKMRTLSLAAALFTGATAAQAADVTFSFQANEINGNEAGQAAPAGPLNVFNLNLGAVPETLSVTSGTTVDLLVNVGGSIVEFDDAVFFMEADITDTENYSFGIGGNQITGTWREMTGAFTFTDQGGDLIVAATFINASLLRDDNATDADFTGSSATTNVVVNYSAGDAFIDYLVTLNPLLIRDSVQLNPNEDFAFGLADVSNVAPPGEGFTATGSYVGTSALTFREVPEPATLALFVVGSAVMLRRRKQS